MRLLPQRRAHSSRKPAAVLRMQPVLVESCPASGVDQQAVLPLLVGCRRGGGGGPPPRPTYDGGGRASAACALALAQRTLASAAFAAALSTEGGQLANVWLSL
ncbi:unnamed protein product [Prorocentrum cordatum]|uniref:Uncharacterized protein n=1 Tax=Prorocentrum cordatum TaxID=2364126 RepID=A0ABN9XTD2_9DINO|nr:unnamed protein product [Polarella glacialis]